MYLSVAVLLGLVSGLLLHIIFSFMSTVLHIQADNDYSVARKSRDTSNQNDIRAEEKRAVYGKDDYSFRIPRRSFRGGRANEVTSPRQNLFRETILEE